MKTSVSCALPWLGGALLAASLQAGTISGQVTYAGTQPGNVVVRAVQLLPNNKVLTLDGDGDFASTTITDLSGAELSIQYWFKGNNMLSAIRQQSGGFIVAGWNGKHIISNDGGTTGVSAGEGTTDGQWHHVVVSWKQGTVGGFASYLDGRLVEKRDSANEPIPSHNAQVFFGSFNGTGEFLQGQLDEIAIWNRALNETEVTANWNRRLTGSESGLVGYWSFDDGSGKDASPNANDAEFWGEAALVDASIPGLGGGLGEVVLDGPGAYTLANLPDGPDYQVTAYRDVSGNLRQGAGEPAGSYAGNPFPLSGSKMGVDIVLAEPPRIVTQPAGTRVATGTDVVLRVAVEGTAPLTYEWRRNDQALADGGRFSGTQTAELHIGGIQEADSGVYTVAVGNAQGTVVSEAAQVDAVAGGIKISGQVTYAGTQKGRLLVTASQAPSGNKVLRLDGNGDSVATPLTDLSGSELTIQYWFRGSAVSSAVRQQGNGYLVAGWGDNLAILSSDGGTAGLSIGKTVTDGAWHQVLVTWKQGTVDGFATYLDGKLVAKRESANVPIPNINAAIYFGAWDGSAEFTKGELDEIAIWRKHFTSSEVATMWRSSPVGTEPELIGFWSFNDGTANDLTTAGNNGELKGDAAIVDEDIAQMGNVVTGSFEGVGAYELTNVTPGPGYRVSAFLDVNTNGVADATEPSGQYGGNPINVTASVANVDITLTEAPRITAPPVQARTAPGGNATFSVAAVGTEPLTYRWFKEGAPLADGGKISGTQTATLQLSGVTAGEAGRYTVEVTNAKGKATSRPAELLLVAGGLSLAGNLQYGGAPGRIYVTAAHFPNDDLALRLNGSGGFAAVNGLTDLSGSELTIEFWFKGSSIQSAVRQQSGGWAIAGWNGFHILSNDGGLAGVSLGAEATDGGWHHVAMTWKQATAGGFASYLDGKLVEQRDSADEPIPNHGAPVYFGSFNGTDEFANGLLDEIAIWHRALTAEEIRAGMKGSLTGTEEGLTGYWNFNDGTGKDLGPNAFDAELKNGATVVVAENTPRNGGRYQDVLGTSGPYTMANLPPATNYRVTAFVDQNGDGQWNEGEPTTAYAANPFDLAANMTGVNLDLGGAVEAPALGITRTAGKLTISWPSGVTGFTLESSEALSGASWTAVSGVENNSATVEPAGGARFFRLRQ